MTIKDFFKILIKIFGLYTLIATVFVFMPANLGILIYDLNVLSIGLLIFSLGVIIALFCLLIFNTEIIIKWLKLDKNYDNDIIDFKNLNEKMVYKIAIITISSLLTINNLPVLLTQCFKAFKSQVSPGGLLQELDNIIFEPVDYSLLFSSGFTILISYLMISNHDRISNYFSK